MTPFFRRVVVVPNAIALYLAPLGSLTPAAACDVARDAGNAPDVLVVGVDAGGRDGRPCGGAPRVERHPDQRERRPRRDPHRGFAEIYARLGAGFTPQAAERTFAELVAQEPRITVLYDEAPSALATEVTNESTRVEDIPAISATHLASGSARAIATTIEEGDAAGRRARSRRPSGLRSACARATTYRDAVRRARGGRRHARRASRSVARVRAHRSTAAARLSVRRGRRAVV